MRKVWVLLLIIGFITSCTNHPMSTEEQQLITAGQENDPMRVLTILDDNDLQILRAISTDVDDPKNIKQNADWQLLFKRLRVTMEIEGGIGIAAPQVGINRNIFLFTRLNSPEMDVVVAINPRITACSEEMFCFEGDGCLSIPDYSDNSLRHQWVEVSYYTEEGEKVEERLYGGSRGEDFTGVIFQHEFDHLKGLLFTDRPFETFKEEDIL